MRKSISYGTLVTGLVLLGTGVASAHVIVTPATVGIASHQEFSMSVPNEKEVNVVGLRLLIPSGLDDVSPSVKPGWTIDIKKSGSGDDVKVTEIDWTAGNIPVGQRDDFTFSAQAPANTGELDWKAYQSYSDGTTVSWDQKPVAGKADDDSLTPYSVTQVINDLNSPGSTTDATDTTARWLGGVALVLGLGGVLLGLRRKQQ